MATCASSHAFINGGLSGVGFYAYSHIKQEGWGRLGSLLPFDINQVKASPHLLLNLFSAALRTFFLSLLAFKHLCCASVLHLMFISSLMSSDFNKAKKMIQAFFFSPPHNVSNSSCTSLIRVDQSNSSPDIVLL